MTKADWIAVIQNSGGDIAIADPDWLDQQFSSGKSPYNVSSVIKAGQAPSPPIPATAHLSSKTPLTIPAVPGSGFPGKQWGCPECGCGQHRFSHVPNDPSSHALKGILVFAIMVTLSCSGCFAESLSGKSQSKPDFSSSNPSLMDGGTFSKTMIWIFILAPAVGAITSVVLHYRKHRSIRQVPQCVQCNFLDLRDS